MSEKFNAVKRILVPCDFSEQSVNALKFAVHLENTSKGEILLLYIVELPFLHDKVLMPTLYFEEERFQDLRKNAELKLNNIIKGDSVPEVRLTACVMVLMIFVARVFIFYMTRDGLYRTRCKSKLLIVLAHPHNIPHTLIAREIRTMIRKIVKRICLWSDFITVVV